MMTIHSKVLLILILIIFNNGMAKKLTIKANNIDTFVETFGKNNDPAILLIIGASAVSTFYPDFFCESMAKKGFFIIRYDLRDYGGSTHFKSIDPSIMADKDLLKKQLPYSIEDLAKDAKSILNYFKIEKVNLVGHSVGGIIAQLLAIFYPDNTTSLTIISSPIAVPTDLNAQASPEVMKILMENNPVGNLKEDKDGWMRIFKAINGDLFFDEKMAFHYLQTMYARESSPGMVWNHIAIQQNLQDYAGKLNNNKIPTLIIHGQNDPLVPVICAEKNQQIIRNSQLEIIPLAGHMFFNKEVWKKIEKMLSVHIKYTQP